MIPRRRILCAWLALLCALVGVVRLFAMPPLSVSATDHPAQPDSLRYPVQPTAPESYEWLEQESALDLRTPSVVTHEFVYNPATGLYLLVTKVGGKQVGTPIPYTLEQYVAYVERNGVQNYFLERAAQDEKEQQGKGFNPFDFGFELGPAEKIFGPGGVRVRTQGSAEVSMGVKSNATDNPSIPIRSRRHTFFDFDQKIQANVQASVGTKLNFNLNYNTQATFDFDSKKLKLAYEGEEDDIIKVLEAGNVSLQSKNSLIQGGASLFGIHSKLQFGKLDVDFVVSQQEAETKRVSTDRGAQTTPFEFSANQYDENRHFYLGHYFRDHYNKAMSTLPFISSGVKINRIEVWVTNKRGNFDEARNIVAFTDMGEAERVTARGVTTNGSTQGLPANQANSLYSWLLGQPALRQVDQVSQMLEGQLRGGVDYAKIESARRLNANEYRINDQLGTLSLQVRLQPDEVVGVAFEYTYQGKVYQVGEFSSDRSDRTADNLFVKLLKGSSMTPTAPYWQFMMRNVYSLGSSVYNLKAEHFKLDVFYRNDSTGTAVPYINEGKVAGQLLTRVLGMDRLDSRNEPHPDGVFDFVPGFTVDAERGLVIFTSTEPFGSYLAEQIGDPAIAERYVYREIYDTTMVAAQQVAERDKFILRGEYQAANSGQISLGAMNVTPGSVRVTAGGATLVENVDYTVNYAMGTVTILNEAILNSGTRVDVSLENRGFLNLQRKTVLGLDLNYHFTPDLTLGGTFMYLSEMPLTAKPVMGRESMQNSLWGLNLSWRTESQWLTRILDYIPLLDLTKPSEVALNMEFAHLIPGHYEGRYTKGHSYIDDFETSQSSIDLLNPYAWMLSSTPWHDPADGAADLFPEARLVNDLRYGNRRALLNWFYIDPMLNRAGSSLTPSYLRNNPDMLSNHYSREVRMSELFPYRDENFAQQSYLQTLCLAYYPDERGPYNVNSDQVGSDGKLMNPTENWGGMMRKIDQSDFEAANIEYIEFWMMDPFIYPETAPTSGKLFFNLGEVSEEVLKDEKKFFENGMPLNDDPSATIETVWGRVPIRQTAGYSFDNAAGARSKQDVGFNGLSSEQEKTFPAYADYLSAIRGKVSGEVLEQWQGDPMSPLNDPAGDSFRHYRDERYDQLQAPILERYKYYNGVEGNSAEATNETGSYSVASRVVPDVEDINQDNTLNEQESYFEYELALSPAEMQVGHNYIVDERSVNVKLANGKQETVKWYQFKIPVREPTRRVGGIADLKSIRFMRLYLTQWDKPVVLRFGTFKMVRGEWRQYDRPLHAPSVTPISNGTMEVNTVNIEENGDRKPINYILPPGVSRSVSPSQAQAIRQNEQALSLRIKRLAPGDARAVYKNTGLDLRRYKRIELFVHAEELPEEGTPTGNGEMTAFLRLGTDYTNNYYEYSVPLELTPFGTYSDNAKDREMVWPRDNKVDFRFDLLTGLKMKRNAAQANGETDLYTPYSVPDAERPRNTITVMGNPSLSNVKTIMIGVRNSAGQIKSAEIWVNELRLSEYQEQGGWATNADLQVQLSDLGSFNARGSYRTAGFGALDQSLAQRQLEDTGFLNLSTQVELGKFFPEKAKVRIPLYYSYQNEVIRPQYNPLDQDLLLTEALDNAANESVRDSIKTMALTRTQAHALSLSNVGVNIQSKTPMPYDPANFTFGYSRSWDEKNSPEIVYDRNRTWQATAQYQYTPVVAPWKPFTKLQQGKGSSEAIRTVTSTLRAYQINYLPSRLAFNSSILRNYSEHQVRNLMPGGGAMTDWSLPATFVQNFVWQRAANIVWNPTTNLKLSFNSGTNARIVEPHVQVNRELAPDDYTLWRDSVWQSIRSWGLPMQYNQTANATYTLPLALIPFMDFVSATATYMASYNWDRGALTQQGASMGNVVRNQMKLDGRVNILFQTLYRKFDWYKDYEKRQNKSNNRDNRSASRRDARVSRPDQEPADKAPEASQRKKPAPLRFTKEVVLRPDTTITINHQLGSAKPEVTAKDSLGHNYPVKYAVVNPNSITVTGTDSVTIRLNVYAADKAREMRMERVYPYIDAGISLLTFLRDISLTYTRTSSLHLPGFLPDIKAAGGQGYPMQGVMAPGLAFAFGFTDNDFVREAAQRGWLLKQAENINPAMYSLAEDATARLNLEPLKDLKVTLTWDYHTNRAVQTQYMFEGAPETYSGTFTAGTIGLKGFFASANASDGYKTSTFDNLLSYQQEMVQRLTNQYSAIAGADAPEVRPNSPDVLIPAFIAAYTARGLDGATPFHSIWRTLPNWSITYTGLTKIPVLADLFRNFSLSHTYRNSYSVANYNSFISWQPIAQEQRMGYIEMPADDATGGANGMRRVASSPYDITQVSIRESFAPLIGVEITLQNGLGFNTRWNKSRDLMLNLTSFQVIENSRNEISVGINYKVDDFSKLIGIKRRAPQRTGAQAQGGHKENPLFASGGAMTLRCEYSYNHSSMLIRKIQEAFTQATNGNVAHVIKLSADYALSRMLTIRGYFDWNMNHPLVSTASFPVNNTSFGVALRISLTQQ